MYISAAFERCILLGKIIFQKVLQSVISSLFLLINSHNCESLSGNLPCLPTHHYLEVFTTLLLLFFSDDCSQATIPTRFYDILIPKLSYAQYDFQCS